MEEEQPSREVEEEEEGPGRAPVGAAVVNTALQTEP